MIWNEYRTFGKHGLQHPAVLHPMLILDVLFTAASQNTAEMLSARVWQAWSQSSKRSTQMVLNLHLC